MAHIDKDPKNKIQQVKGSVYQEQSKKSSNFDKESDTGKSTPRMDDSEKDQIQKNNNQPDNQNETDTGTNIDLDDVFML